jgi:hypothetical protein
MLNFKKCDQLGKKISFEKGFSTVSYVRCVKEVFNTIASSV